VLGCGFLESVYVDALSVEFESRGIPFRREVEIPVLYKDVRLNASYRADFVCYDSVIVEVKALPALTSIQEAQIINYLKAAKVRIGLLLNFGSPRLQHKRFIQG